MRIDHKSGTEHQLCVPRMFTFGHVRQLDAVACRVLAGLASGTPLLARVDEDVLVDVDDTIIEVYGYAKQGASSGTQVSAPSTP